MTWTYKFNLSAPIGIELLYVCYNDTGSFYESVYTIIAQTTNDGNELITLPEIDGLGAVVRFRMFDVNDIKRYSYSEYFLIISFDVPNDANKVLMQEINLPQQ